MKNKEMHGEVILQADDVIVKGNMEAVGFMLAACVADLKGKGATVEQIAALIAAGLKVHDEEQTTALN